MISDVKTDGLIKPLEAAFAIEQGVRNHTNAANHLEAAAQYHRDAARWEEAGNRDKAQYCTLLAIGHSAKAGELQFLEAKRIAMIGI